MAEEPEIDPEKVEKAHETQLKPEEDPAYTQEKDLQEMEKQVGKLHDNIDQLKDTGMNLADYLREKAQEAETEEIKWEYERLAEAARTAYRRIEFGDWKVRRGGV